MQYKVEKVGRNIMDKLKARTEIIRQHCDNQAPILKSSLINFPAYLATYKFTFLQKWVLLNDIVREEHPA